MRIPRLKVPWLRVSAGVMQDKSMGRLPPDLAAGGSVRDPEPEYIAEAVPASEELWAREAARYAQRMGTSSGDQPQSPADEPASGR